MINNHFFSINPFLKLNLLAVAGFIFTSYFGYSLLPLISILFWIGLLFYLFKFNKLNQELVIKFTILFLSLAITTPFFTDLYLSPSNDDTINHLGFLEAILNSNNALLGMINRPGAEFFGESKYHFYPTGSHALTAIWIYPWVKFLKLDWVNLYKIESIIYIAAWPLALWHGSKIAFKNISAPLRAFLVISASTLPTFPLWPLGEGGLPRIAAIIIITPLWFEFIVESKKMSTGIIWTALFAPVLLFIHPAILPFIGLAILFFSKRSILGSILGIPFGVFFFYLMIHSAKQEVTDPGFIESILAPIRNHPLTSIHLWFDRLKGPFHYWFSDPYGYGKFLSPKNWMIYYGFFLALSGKLNRTIILLFLTPFLIAGISLIPNAYLDQLGLIYYHSVKRIAEITPLLGITIALFAANQFKHDRALRYVFISISLIFIIKFKALSTSSIASYNELYHSPTHSHFDPLIKKIKSEIQDSPLIIDRHEYDIVRFMISTPSYTLSPECMETGKFSNYCISRKDWQQQALKLKNEKSVWWIPELSADSKEVEVAKKAGKTVIEINSNTHLIKLNKQ